MVAIKLIAIMIVGVLSIFGLIGSKVVDVNLSKIPIISSLVQEQKPVNPNINMSNIPGVPEPNVKSFDLLEWLGRAPLQDLWNYAASGTKGIVVWISELITNLIAGGFKIINPNVRIPAFLGTVVFLLIVAFFIYKGFDILWGLGHTVVVIALIFLFVVFGIAILLAWLNLLPV